MSKLDSAFFASAVEAIVLASPEPIQARKIVGVIDEATSAEVARAIAALNERYADSGSSFRIRELAGGYQFYIMPEYVGFVEELFARRRKLRLTRAALETVAIIAYRQPVTKAEIEHVRGVASDGVIHNLLEKKMITIVGRAETVGKPLQYGTADEFLKFFGLNKLTDLPKMSEIEELVKASERQNQTELVLEEHADGEIKLNVADGTYTPDEDAGRGDTETPVVEDNQADLEPEEPGEEADSDDSSAVGRLVLKQPASAPDEANRLEEKDDQSEVIADLDTTGQEDKS